MIKIIAFDLVGVLVHEKDIKLTKEEQELEHLFGPNINDNDYLIKAKQISKEPIKTTYTLINKLYKTYNKNIIKKLKRQGYKLIVATNHISYIKKYIKKHYKMLDDIIISAKIKPNEDFYIHILNKYKIKPEELLFIDDNIKNIESANNLKIKTIKVNKNTNLLKEIYSNLKKM